MARVEIADGQVVAGGDDANYSYLFKAGRVATAAYVTINVTQYSLNVAADARFKRLVRIDGTETEASNELLGSAGDLSGTGVQGYSIPSDIAITGNSNNEPLGISGFQISIDATGAASGTITFDIHVATLEAGPV